MISVVVCTHNPRRDYFERSLASLQQQGLPQQMWELLVIDNNSTPPLGTWIDLCWHRNARIVIEPTLGLPSARRRGFREARHDLIVNLDDDVVLPADFLEQVREVTDKHPFIGVFGSQYDAEFEERPTHPPHYYYAAQRRVEHDLWSNIPENIESTPWGAGSVVRRVVAERYLQRTIEDPRLLELGRRGKALLSCEDIDIANSTRDVGMGKGVFKQLRFTHLIPKAKMTDEFRTRNAYWNHYSAVIHNYLSYGRVPPPRSWQNLLQLFLRSLFRPAVVREEMFGQVRAERAAVKDMKRRGWI